MKRSKKILIIMAIVLGAYVPMTLAADAEHENMDGHDKAMNAQQTEDMFLEKRNIDGYDVQFHVMKVSPGLEHGGSHNFMVKIEDQGKVLEDVVINSKVIDPSGASESKYLNKMGEWYMNGYDLGKKGKYQLIILFKTADGKKHKGGVYYQGAGY